MDNLSTPSNATPQHKGEMFAIHTKITMYSVLLVCSLLGNILVIAVVMGNKSLRTVFNYMIVNMAVSDLFVPMLALPVRISEETSGWLVDGPLGNALCKLCFFFADISPVVSVLSLVIIATERFVLIVYPFKSQAFNRRTCWVLIATTWIIAIALFSPYFYTFRLFQRDGSTQCNPQQWSQVAQDVFLVIVTSVSFIIPFISIVILYSVMIFKLHQNSKRLGNSLSEEQASYRRRRNKDIFYLSIAVVVAFCVLWGPFFCALLLINFLYGWDGVDGDVIFIVQYLGYLNSAVNPCIYFIFLKSFQKGLRNICCSKHVRQITVDARAPLVIITMT
jgi:hypothetical protein